MSQPLVIILCHQITEFLDYFLLAITIAFIRIAISGNLRYLIKLLRISVKTIIFTNIDKYYNMRIILTRSSSSTRKLRKINLLYCAI